MEADDLRKRRATTIEHLQIL